MEIHFTHLACFLRCQGNLAKPNPRVILVKIYRVDIIGGFIKYDGTA